MTHLTPAPSVIIAALLGDERPRTMDDIAAATGLRQIQPELRTLVAAGLLKRKHSHGIGSWQVNRAAFKGDDG